VDFSYTEVQQMLQDQVQKFVQKSYDFDTRNEIVASEAGYSKEFWQLFAELGWLAVPFSEQDGGLGGSAVDLMVMMEEFGKAMLVEPYTATAVLGGSLIANLSDGDQKETLIGSIIGGEVQLACAYVEPQSRFNPLNIETSATVQGDSISLSGTKIAVENGGNADKLIVIARESGAATGLDGLSAFLVDASANGVKLTAYTSVDGRKAAQVQLDNVQLSAGDRVGAAGAAGEALLQAIDKATVGVCAEAVGALESLLAKTVEYSKTRKQFGTPIGSFQALQHRMADMFIECQLARSIVMMAAMTLDSQEDAVEKTKAVSAAKSRIGKAIRAVGQEAIQIHGGIGMTEELDVGHLFKRVTALDIQFGDGEYHTERYASL